MWHFQVLLLILGSSSFWGITEEASTPLPEDEATTIDAGNVNTYDSDAPTPLPTRIHHTTGHPDIEDKPTTEAIIHSTVNSTDSRVIIDHSNEKVGGKTKTTEKGGLETVALVGIILGIVIAIGIIAGIVIAVVRKMSGRYSQLASGDYSIS